MINVLCNSIKFNQASVNWLTCGRYMPTLFAMQCESEWQALYTPRKRYKFSFLFQQLRCSAYTCMLQLFACRQLENTDDNECEMTKWPLQSGMGYSELSKINKHQKHTSEQQQQQLQQCHRPQQMDTNRAKAAATRIILLLTNRESFCPRLHKNKRLISVHISTCDLSPFLFVRPFKNALMSVEWKCYQQNRYLRHQAYLLLIWNGVGLTQHRIQKRKKRSVYLWNAKNWRNIPKMLVATSGT